MPHIELGDTVVPVSTVAKNIGVFFDDALSMNNQVQHICRVAYFISIVLKKNEIFSIGKQQKS